MEHFRDSVMLNEHTCHKPLMLTNEVKTCQMSLCVFHGMQDINCCHAGICRHIHVNTVTQKCLICNTGTTGLQ